MATTLDELVVKISADVADLNAKFAEAQAATSSTMSNMQKSIEDFSQNSQQHLSGFSRATDTAMGVFSGGLLVEAVKRFAELAVEAFKEITTESVAAAEKQEDAVNRLNVALASAGQYSKDASEGFQDFAHVLQETTKYSEEDVLSAGALIEQLGRLDKDGLQKATAAAVNLSSALGIDLNSAAMLVGRAATGNVQLFSRYGLVVQQGADNAHTFANALAAIGAMGDVAAGQANTYSGSVAQMGHAWEDVQKQIGNAIVGNQAIIEIIKVFNSGFHDAAEIMKENETAIKEYVISGVMVAIDGIRSFAEVLDGMYRVGEAAWDGLGVIVNTACLVIESAILLPIMAVTAFIEKIPGIGNAFQGMSEGIANHLKSLGASIKQGATDFGNDWTQQTGTMETIEKGLDKLNDAAMKGFAAVASGARSVPEPLNNANAKLDALSKAQIRLGEEGKKLADQYSADVSFEVRYNRDLKALEAANKQKLISDQVYVDSVVKEHELLEKKLEDQRKKQVDDLIKRNELLIAIDEDGNAAEIESNKKKIGEILKSEKTGSDLMLEVQKKHAQEEAAIEKSRTDAMKSSISALTIFQNSQNSAMAAVGKSAAIASTTISTYEGATKAYAALAGIPIVGPELGAAAMAAFIANGLAQVAQIEGVQLASGIDSVPGIGHQDNFPAVLAPNERVVPADTNKDLKEFLSGKGAMIQLLQQIASGIRELKGGSGPLTVVVGGKTIASVMRDEVRSGRLVFA